MCCLSLIWFFQSGGQDQERKHKKRRGEFYSIQTSLIVAALKKMLPIGLNMCTPGDQELISLAKARYLLVRQVLCDNAPVAFTNKSSWISKLEFFTFCVLFVYYSKLFNFAYCCLTERHRRWSQRPHSAESSSKREGEQVELKFMTVSC